MIVVDTSVWVAAFRGDAAVVPELTRLLDHDHAALTSPVRLELLSGARPSELARLRRVLGAVPTYVPAPSAWQRIEGWVDVAAKAGHRFGVMDLLIGATAREQGVSVWSLDRDFERMAALRFIKVHRLRA